MIDWRRDEVRTYALRVITLLLVVSFAFIPVRCDASSAPHSIFLDPIPSGGGQDVRSSSTAMTDHSHHHAAMHHAAKTAASDDSAPAQDVCALTQAEGTDLQSQQPVGAALDLPVTPVAPMVSALLPLEGERLMPISAPTTTLTGISAPPEAPPPKSA